MDRSPVSVKSTTGEISFKLNGREEKLKASFQAIADIEHALGYGIVPLVMRIQSKNYGLKEASLIIYHGMLAADLPYKPTFEAVIEQVFKAGLLSFEVVSAMTLFCELALNGGRPVGEDQQAEEAGKS